MHFAILTVIGCIGGGIGEGRIAAETTVGTLAGRMAEKAKRFLDALDASQKAKARMEFSNPARTDWHWIPKPTRKGIALREMSAPQKEAALQLIQTGLSDVGYKKFETIRQLEDVLKIQEKDTRDVRESGKYYVAIFGDPGADGPWGWSCEGHHFSLNYAIEGGAIIASEPEFFGANPRLMTTRMEVGPPKGARTLDDEERFAFELAKSFDDKQRAAGATETLPPRTLQTGPPANLYSGPPVGIAASAMTPAQRETLRRILDAYLQNAPDEVRRQRMREIESRGTDSIHFLWMGTIDLDSPHYFRVHGPSFIIELDNVQSDPLGRQANHIHSVWRKPATSAVR